MNTTRHVQVGKLQRNLAKIKAIGFQANRRLLCDQRLSHDYHDYMVGVDRFEHFRTSACAPQSVGWGLCVPRCKNLTQRSSFRLHKQPSEAVPPTDKWQRRFVWLPLTAVRLLGLGRRSRVRRVLPIEECSMNPAPLQDAVARVDREVDQLWQGRPIAM